MSYRLLAMKELFRVTFYRIRMVVSIGHRQGNWLAANLGGHASCFTDRIHAGTVPSRDKGRYWGTKVCLNRRETIERSQREEWSRHRLHILARILPG